MKNLHTLVIGVIYNTYPEAGQYLETLVNCYFPGLKVVLVDNSELEPTASFSSRVNELDFVTLLRTGENLGYLHGARVGYEHAVKKLGGSPQWVLVTNVDILFNDRDLFSKINRYNDDQHLGILAPSIITLKWKTDLNPQVVSRYSYARMRFYSFLYRSYLLTTGYIFLSLLRRKLKGFLKSKPVLLPGPSSQVERVIYAPHGSCIIFHRNYFKKGGSLQHVAFLFAEELFLAEEARRLKLRVIYAPWMWISDLEHVSTGRFLSRKMIRFRRQSIDAIIKKYYR